MLNCLFVMLDLLRSRMILANEQRWWYIPYGGDKQAPDLENVGVVGRTEGKLGLVYE